jgi:hypothetical protein
MEKLEEVLAAYRRTPMDNGDAAIVTDLDLVIEVEGMGDLWDRVAGSNICRVLRETGAQEIALAVARPESELLAQDHAMWADIREELLGAGIILRDPIGLPAAA